MVRVVVVFTSAGVVLVSTISSLLVVDTDDVSNSPPVDVAAGDIVDDVMVNDEDEDEDVITGEVEDGDDEVAIAAFVVEEEIVDEADVVSMLTGSVVEITAERVD